MSKEMVFKEMQLFCIYTQSAHANAKIISFMKQIYLQARLFYRNEKRSGCKRAQESCRVEESTLLGITPMYLVVGILFKKDHDLRTYTSSECTSFSIKVDVDILGHFYISR